MVTDPVFYDEVVRLAQESGTRAEDLLFCWAEATLLEPAGDGSARTFAGLAEGQTLGVTMPKAIWDALGAMPAEHQLAYVEAAVLEPARGSLGRPLRSAFEVCLAHVAPGLLRADGAYDFDTPLHAGADYPDHWPLDEYPAAWGLYRSLGGSPRGSFVRSKSAAEKLGAKGYVSLGDFRAFCLRSDPNRDAVLRQALMFLDESRGRLGVLAEDDSSYVSDFDEAFPLGAPRESRSISPEQARRSTPPGTKGWFLPLQAKWIFAAGLGLVILPLSLHLHARTHA